MSILQEYKTIRESLGEKRYQEVEEFLAENPDLILSDVYYKESIWNKFEQWAFEKFGTPKTIKQTDPFEEMLNDKQEDEKKLSSTDSNHNQYNILFNGEYVNLEDDMAFYNLRNSPVPYAFHIYKIENGVASVYCKPEGNPVQFPNFDAFMDLEASNKKSLFNKMKKDLLKRAKKSNFKPDTSQMSSEENQILWNELITNELKDKPYMIGSELGIDENIVFLSFERYHELEKEKVYSQLKGKAIAFDIETTGLGEDDEILQISIVDEDMNIIFDSYLKPERHTEWEEAQTIHHITPEMVKDAPTLNEVGDKLINIFDACESVIGYNHIQFDVPFIERELDHSIIKPLHDVMYMYANYIRDENKYGTYNFKKLTHLIDNLGFKDSGYLPEGKTAHDACYDVLATMYGYNKLKNMDLESKKIVNPNYKYTDFFNKNVEDLLKQIGNDESYSSRIAKANELLKEEFYSNYSILKDVQKDGYSVIYNNKYKQTIIFDDNDNVKDVACTCPDCQGGTKFCKHLIGSLLDLKQKRMDKTEGSNGLDSKFLKEEIKTKTIKINRDVLSYFYGKSNVETISSTTVKANSLPEDFVWNIYSDGSGGLSKNGEAYSSYDMNTGEYWIMTDSGKSYRKTDSLDKMLTDVERTVDRIFINNKEYLHDKVKREIMTAQADLKQIDTFMYRGAYGSQIPLDIINETVAKVEEYNNTGTFKEIDSSRSIEESKKMRENALEFILGNTPGNVKDKIDADNLAKQIDNLHNFEKQYFEKENNITKQIVEEKKSADTSKAPKPKHTPSMIADKVFNK